MKKKSNIAERGKANIEVAAGIVQEGVGAVLGNPKMKAKGAAHQVAGEARDAAAKRSERAIGAAEEAAGAAKHIAGAQAGKTVMEVEGAIEQLTGKARQAFNK